MAYANTQKNGSLNESLEMHALEMSERYADSNDEEKSITQRTSDIEHSQNSFTAT